MNVSFYIHAFGHISGIKLSYDERSDLIPHKEERKEDKNRRRQTSFTFGCLTYILLTKQYDFQAVI